MSSNVSRRSFFKGAGLAAMGALTAGTLSGCGQGYAAATPANPSAGDFDGPSWLGTPPVIDEADIAETINTEVLVVGMGTGGIPAMISAAENGARVLGIDRQGTPHNVREDIGAIDSRLQQASFDEFPEFRIEKKEAVEDIVRYANGFVNYDLVKLWADESGAMVDWLTDIIQRDGKLVMEFEGGVGDTSDPGRDKAFATGHSPQKTDAVAEDEEWGFAESILAYAAEQGAEVRWYTEFIKCETDESGRVTGVIARDVQGERPYLRINASKGVILSTGGYGNNLEMMEDRQAWNQKIRIAAPGSGGNSTGSGIKAALWAGAVKDITSATMIFDRGLVAPGTTAGYTEESVKAGNPQWPGNGQFNPGTQPFLKVNLRGERFALESADYDYLPHAAAQQPGGVYISVWDGNFGDDVQRFHTLGCSAGTRMGVLGVKKEDGTYDLDKYFEKELADGRLQKADTLDELADKLGFDADAKKTFLATCERYNELYDNQEDVDFGKEPYRLSELRTPPFFGATLGGTLLTTIDGIRINADCQALNTDFEPIEGLYCAGDCSGSLFSGNYPDQMHGVACGRTMTEALHVVKLVAAK